MGEMRNACTTADGRPEIKQPFERSRQRRQNNIKIKLRKVWLASVEWILLAQNRK
jgi:hypothetical protein